MKIETVTARAFGPFRGESLKLAPGMNVIYGPNESGKSSWHAAIYTALCGMKRTRGQPTREDREFTAKHRPWNGTKWQVAAVVSLDDARTIDIEQVLDSTGRSIAIDHSTKEPLGNGIFRAGAVDALSLLGLTRETAFATLFVRQADILRVLTDASALQEYLERAAATSAFDATADEAIARIVAYRREQVGLLRVGARGPFAVASRNLEDARAALDVAEERFESYQQLLVRKRTAETEVGRVEDQLREVLDHERERLHQQRWQEIYAAKRRLGQARRLQEEISSGPQEAGPAKEVIAVATRALAAFEARPDEPAILEGHTADALEQELQRLPAIPEGDLEPARELTTSLDTWRRESHRLATHEESKPLLGHMATLPVPPSELWHLADELELPLPVVDQSLVDEVQERRRGGVTSGQSTQPFPSSSPRSSSRTRVAIAIGGSLVAAALGLTAAGQVIVASVLLVLGVVLAGVGAMQGKTRAAYQVSRRGGEPTSPRPDAEITRLKARLAVQEETLAQARRRREGTLARLAELGLPIDVTTLRQLAAEGEAATSARSRLVEWARREAELVEAVRAAAESLRTALSVRGMPIRDDIALEETFQAYTEACRQRATVARQAGRRADLEAQLVNRRSIEHSWAQDIAARAMAEQQLRDAARLAGCEAAPIDQVAKTLYDWVALQEERTELHQQQAKASALLDQLLDGQTVEQLQASIQALRENAGSPPLQDRTLEDRSAEIETLRSSVQKRRDDLAELIGKIEGAEGHLPDLSAAIETEARAEAEMHRIKILAEDLDAANEILGAAQEKVHADIAPILNETIRPWVKNITCGRYDDIRVDPASLEVEAHETGGDFHSATVLSHGTKEQLFLLLRVALAQHLATTGEKAPIVLDDVTVQSDTHRTVAILDLLHE